MKQNINHEKEVFLIITLLCSFAFVSLADETTGSWSDYRDTTWGTDYASASSFTISTAAQLAQLAYLVNDEHKDFSGKTVTQTDNIDLCGHYLKVFGKYYLQGIGLLDVEPSALQTFLIGGFDVQERVVDEEALLSRSSYLANCMMIYL